MNMTSTDFKDMLLSNLALGLTFGGNLFIGRAPTKPDDCVTLFDAGGPPSDRTLAGARYYRDSVSIQVRNSSYVAGYALAELIEDFLMTQSQTIWNGVLYTLITSENGIITDNWDENSNNTFMINFTTQRTLLAEDTIDVNTSTVGDGVINSNPLVLTDIEKGTIVSLNATANTGSRFVNWLIAGISYTNRLVSFYAVKTVSAIATFIAQFQLTTSVDGEGTITPVSGLYDIDSVVEVEATPTETYWFEKLVINGIDTITNPVNVVMNELQNIVAHLNDTFYNSNVPAYLKTILLNDDFTSNLGWVIGLGTPTAWDINSTIADNLYIKFTSGNQSIKMVNLLDTSKNYQFEVRIKRLDDGVDLTKITELNVSFFATDVNDNYTYALKQINEDYSIHKYVLRDLTSPDLYIGCVSSKNFGGSFAIDYLKITEIDVTGVEDVETIAYEDIVNDFNRVNFLKDVETKTLTKFLVLGDSIMANYYGDAIPAADDEGEKERPPRMTINNVPRRLHDYIKNNNNIFTTPNYRRIDHDDWTMGTPFINTNGVDVISPTYIDTVYAYSPVSSNYAEIVVPNGNENFAFILHASTNLYNKDYEDAATVTINGGDISSYGDSIINTYIDKYSVFGLGNAFYMVEYNNLPVGDNTIRITKAANQKTLMIWGCLYWTGNTYIVHNSAFGGYNNKQLYQRVLVDIIDNNYDAVFLQTPGMNEASDSNTLNEEQKWQEYIINLLLQNTSNIALYGTHPFGDNGAGTNYYTLYSDPATLKEYYFRIRNMCYRYRIPFTNVFKEFEDLIISRGGTLDGGEGGLWYTTDGQHPNAEGAEIFADYLTSNLFLNKLK